jgi:hypothetical protein
MGEKHKTALAIFASIASVLLPLTLYIHSLKDRGLSYEIISGPIISKDRLVDLDGVDVLFKKEKIENIDASYIKLENTGDVPIRKEDFDSDIIIEFNNNLKILKAEKWGSRPKSIQVSTKINNHGVLIEPLLLNKGEFISIQVLTTGDYIEPSLNARVVGLDYLIENTSSEKPKELRYTIYLILGILSAGIYCYFSIITFYTYRHRYKAIPIPRFFLIIAALSTMYGGVALTNRYLILKGLSFFSWPFAITAVVMAIFGYCAYLTKSKTII